MIRYMPRYIALVLSLIVCLPVAIARPQGDMSKVEIKSSPVAGNVYMLQGSGGNIGVSVGTLPDKWNSWGAGFVNTKTWINIVYQSLSKPR